MQLALNTYRVPGVSGVTMQVRVLGVLPFPPKACGLATVAIFTHKSAGRHIVSVMVHRYPDLPSLLISTQYDVTTAPPSNLGGSVCDEYN